MAQQNQQNIFQNSLTEEEPPHPKTFTHIPLKSNNQKINKLSLKLKFKDNQISIQTARQAFRKNQQKSPQRDVYTSRNSRAVIINAPSNNNSPKAEEDQLFVPQRKKFNQSNKFFSQKRSLKQKSTSFNTSSNLRESDISIKLFQKIPTNNSLMKKNVNPITSQQNRATIHHISHLRKFQNTQKQRQTQLSNRLRFFTVQKQRDTKRLQFVKRKYQKVVAVRSQFIKQKQSIQKKKIVNYLDQMNQKHRKISRIKYQHQQKKLSVSRLSQAKSLEASRLRSEERSITFQIKTKQIKQIQKKRQAVKVSQLRSQKAHQKLIEANKSRIETIRSIEDKQVVKSYLNISKRHKMNQILQERLQKEIALISQNKEKSQNQLKKYEEFLGLRNKRQNLNKQLSKNRMQPQNSNNFHQRKNYEKPIIGSNAYNTSRSKSFYLTNY